MSKSDTTWKKGQSGNPAGRPKKSLEVENACRMLLEGEDGRNKALDRLSQLMLSDDEKVAVSACNSLLDRAYGKPTQRKETSGPGGNPLELIVATMTDAELVKEAREAMAWLKEEGSLPELEGGTREKLEVLEERPKARNRPKAV